MRLIQVSIFSCERYDAKAVIKKWDTILITMTSSFVAFGSTEEKAVSRALGGGSSIDGISAMPIAGCVCAAVARDGRPHVMSLSFPASSGIPEQCFAFGSSQARDSFMRALQVVLPQSLKPCATCTSAPPLMVLQAAVLACSASASKLAAADDRAAPAPVASAGKPASNDGLKAQSKANTAAEVKDAAEVKAAAEAKAAAKAKAAAEAKPKAAALAKAEAQAKADAKASLVGIGAVLTTVDGRIKIVSLKPDGSAAASGNVRVDDVLVALNGTLVTSEARAEELILGPLGTTVKAELSRSGQAVTVTLWRGGADAQAKGQAAQKAKVEAEANAAAKANASSRTLESHDDFVDSLRGASGLAADVSFIKRVLGGAAALAEHSKVTQQQLEDKGSIRGRPELLLFYGAVCQGLQCMLHIATAFKTGVVQLDKNSSFGSYLGRVSDYYDDAVGAVGQAASRARDLAARVGFFEGAASSMASALDKVAEIADGIPVASFVLKGLSFIVNQVQGLKFDARMQRVIKSLFPSLNPLTWTYVVEEVARRVAVLCAPEIQALYSGTEDCRGRVKNWFRSKCEEYDLATLTSKAEDAVVMLALQKVDCVSQLALSDSVPEGLSEVELADFIVRHVVAPAPALAPTQASAVPSAQLSSAPLDSSLPPPPVALNHVASHDEVEELRKEVGQQRARLKKMEERVNKGNDVPGSGGGLVQALRKIDVNPQTVNEAAERAMRPFQQQLVRVEHQVQELTAHIILQPVSDPVLVSCINKLTNSAISVMKKHDDITGWQQRFVAVRGRWLCYGRSYDAAVQLANSLPHHDASDQHIIDLIDCSACEAPRHDDYDHCAFTLTASSGRSLLLSHRETACVAAIIETIKRCSAPLAAAASALSGLKQSRDEEQHRQLLCKSGEDMS